MIRKEKNCKHQIKENKNCILVSFAFEWERFMFRKLSLIGFGAL
uniref:Uncharacterized protein n=1 Tax=Anguilla anguilla TaxID=7936 RepID=A0A0E9SJD6_ANGAN